MKLLKINVIGNDFLLFKEENQELIKFISMSDEVEIEFWSVTGTRYECYKKALEKADTRYVTFWDEYSVMSESSLVNIINELNCKNEKVCVLPVSNKLNPKLVRKTNTYRMGAVSRFPLHFPRYIFETAYIKEIPILEREYDFFEEKIVLELNKEYEELYLFGESVLSTLDYFEKNINSYGKQFEKKYYLEFFEKFVIPYAKENDLSANQQKMIIYYLVLRFYWNLNGRDKYVIQDEEIDIFFNLVKEVLHYIEDQYIVEMSQRNELPKAFTYLFMKHKKGNDLKCNVECTGRVEYYLNDNFFGKDCILIGLDAINYENECLVIDGQLLGDYFLEDVEKQFHVYLNKQLIHYKKTEVYNITKAFGRSMNRFYSFQLSIPMKMLNKKDRIEFEVEIKGKKVKLPITFKKTASRLIGYKYSYYRFANKMIRMKKGSLIVENAKTIKTSYYELRMIIKMFSLRKNFKEGARAAALRCAYWGTKKKKTEKPIWIFFDKLYKGGDNAEYLFDYCYKNCPEADSYYIINKNAIDYSRLKKKYGKNILEFNSLRQKLMVLHAEMIFATHASVLAFCGFGASLQLCFRNLLNAKVVCIQHGLTIQNIAQYQNRLQDNTQMYFCASKYEVNNLKHPVYGYDGGIYLTGCPRYDGLKNNDKKQILIAPTWRRNIVITGNAVGTSKAYNPEFKKTQYFEIYNRLINDKRLLDIASAKGYKLVFLIHPTLSSQVDDYDKNPYLDIVPAISDISYEKMLTESSLMLTDYSGIQFDFAYMKKPILYYQPKELPPQYTEGVYKYETMGFGPIIDEYEEIIESLCAYMQNNCEMKDEYVKRVEDFFEYTDHSNCERIISAVRGEFAEE